MTTGVDAQTCHLIVLDKRINSMTEFKQIIGRGTRINEDYNKFFFTIMDFRRATALFADPDFDGDPVQIYEPGPDEPPVPPEDEPQPGEEETARRRRSLTRSAATDPPARERHALLRRRRRGPRRHGAGPVPRRGRQAHHRVAQGLHPQDRPQGLRLPRRLPHRLERRRAQAGHPRGACRPGRLPRRTCRAGRPRLRRLRPRLPRRLRPAAAHPAGAGREGAEAQRLRQVRRQGPRRPRSPAPEVRRQRHHAASNRWRSSRWIRSPPSARRSKSSSSSAASSDYLAAIRELETALYQEAA